MADRTQQRLVVQVLDSMTLFKPDQVYLIQFEQHPLTVELRGFSTTASNLIVVLEQSPLFDAPLFRSPVTQDGWSGAKRFHVWVELISKEGR